MLQLTAMNKSYPHLAGKLPAPWLGRKPAEERVTISTVTSDIVALRADHRIDLVPQWAVGLRADLPFLAKDPISSDNPAGNYLYGVGDADFQAALVHEFNSRWWRALPRL